MICILSINIQYEYHQIYNLNQVFLFAYVYWNRGFATCDCQAFSINVIFRRICILYICFSELLRVSLSPSVIKSRAPRRRKPAQNRLTYRKTINNTNLSPASFHIYTYIYDAYKYIQRIQIHTYMLHKYSTHRCKYISNVLTHIAERGPIR